MHKSASGVKGSVIEEHVPVEDIRRLLLERPQARRLVLPGMPAAGSPGMEMPEGRPIRSSWWDAMEVRCHFPDVDDVSLAGNRHVYEYSLSKKLQHWKAA